MPRVKLYNEDEVLERAMELFWKKGYHATSIQDLVSHLRIHRGSLYSSFGDKRQLFDKALLRYREINTKRIAVFLEEQVNVKSGLKNLFQSALTENHCDQDKKGCFLVNTATEMANTDHEIQEFLRSNQEFFTTLYFNYLEDGKSRGEVRKDVNSKTVAHLLFVLYNGIRVIGKINDGQKDTMEAVDLILEMI